MDDDSISPGLKRRLVEMQQHVEALPATLEDHVVERLRREGAFARSRFGIKWLAIAATAAVLFIAGFFTGRTGAKPSVPEFNYVFLLEEGSSYHRATQDAETQRRVTEYREWASTLRSRGVDISGLKLQERGTVFGESDAASFNELAGLFMLKAKNMEEARHIAETCPHIRYGGGIVIRPIEKT